MYLLTNLSLLSIEPIIAFVFFSEGGGGGGGGGLGKEVGAFISTKLYHCIERMEEAIQKRHRNGIVIL